MHLLRMALRSVVAPMGSWWSLESFRDPFDDVRQPIQRLYMTPFVSHKEHLRGFVYDVTNGLLHEVDLTYGGREDR